MLNPAAVAAGGVMNVGANLLTDGASGSDDKVYDTLCQISRDLQALRTYSDRERDRTPYIAELIANFTAGVLDTATLVVFNPASSFNIDKILLTVDTACELVLQMGTRGPAILVNPAASPSPVPLPYHLNGGQTFQIGLIGATTVKVRAFVVGWYEQNRLGPVRTLGDYGD